MSFASVLARLSVAVVVVGIAPAALAARVAVLVPKIDARPAFTDGKRNKFHDTLTKGLQDEAGVSTTVLPGAEVRQQLAGNSELLHCQSGPCLSQAAAQLSADRLVVAHISVKAALGGAAYTIELSVFDQAGGPLAMNITEKCGDDSDGCNLPRAYETLRRASAGVAAQIVSEKAAVKPSDKPVAELQLKDPTAPENPVLVTPPPSPPPDVPPQHLGTHTALYHPGYRYGWIAAVALGGAFVVSSIPFLYFATLEGQTNCGANVPRNQCPQVYQGNGLPFGLLQLGGLASTGAFAVLYYLDKRQQRRTKTALLPVPIAGGAAFQFAGQF
jgi:hypothetical protein